MVRDYKTTQEQRDRAKRYREQNREKAAAAVKAWYENPENIAKRREYFKTYSKSLIKWSVDHVLPLRGKEVSGLHVPSNLAVITLSENVRKGNRMAQGDENRRL